MTVLGPVGTEVTNNWSGYWEPGFSSTNGDTAPRYSELFGRSGVQGEIARALGKRGNRGMRRILLSLIGAAPGAADNESYRRVSNQTPFDLISMGGARPTEVFVVNAGVTTAGEEAYLEALTARNFGAAITYPADRSGNGGGGKVGW